MTAVALTLAALLAALLPIGEGARADRPVRVLRASDSELHLELRTAPSHADGAVSLQEVRFERAARDASWRLVGRETATPVGAMQDTPEPHAFGPPRAAALRALDRSIGEAEGEAAILINLHDGDAAIGIVRDSAVHEAYFADDLVPMLVEAQSRPKARPTSIACLSWPTTADEGAVRVLLLALLDPATQAAASSRLAAEPMRRTRDVRDADADAARAAIRFAQPGAPRPDAPELAPYRWIHLSLEAARGAS
ncbi:MAG: hypothetical protein GC172_06540 [Phycisphaera sp.]|nr:hypothetical protein [Phycisphaera sp.]